MLSKNLKKGSILSENSFFKVINTTAKGVEVEDEHGNKSFISNDYVDNVLSSADYFTKEEKKTMTELSEILLASSRIAITVCFLKKDTAKTQKAYKAEVAAAVKAVQEAPVSKVEALLMNLVENPISKVIPGELREMKGKHNGHMNELGRLDFVDLEDSSALIKQVDPRTIQYIIVGGVKYSLK